MLIFRMAYAGSPSGAGDSGFHSPNMQNGVIRLGRVALGKAGKSAKSQNATRQTPAFIDAHAKQTGRHRGTIACF
jgi:hypothetical protein